MLKHGEVLALDHALHKGARRVGRGVVLALVAHTPHAFYLFVNAGYARPLLPYLERWIIDSHCEMKSSCLLCH